MPMGPDPNPNTASAIGPATMARLEHGPLETRRRSEGIRGQVEAGGELTLLVRRWGAGARLEVSVA